MHFEIPAQNLSGLEFRYLHSAVNSRFGAHWLRESLSMLMVLVSKYGQTDAPGNGNTRADCGWPNYKADSGSTLSQPEND